MKYMVTLLIIMGAMIKLFIFPEEKETTNPSPVGEVSTVMESKILAATFKLRVFNAEETFYEQGIATLVRNQGQTLLITHNHWSFLSSCSKVMILDAKIQPQITLECQAFKSLISYSDTGTLVIQAPEGLRGIPAALGSVHDVQIGQPVIIAHQHSEYQDKIELTTGQIGKNDTFQQSHIIQLDMPDEELFIKGDSGGGVWIDGKLVGNLWANIYERKSGLHFWDFDETTIAAMIPLKITETIHEPDNFALGSGTN